MSKLCDLTAIAEFLYREVRLLDERRFEEWAELFTEDGVYWAPVRQGQESPLDEVSLFYDDRESLEFRIARLRHPHAHFQTPPARTARMISNIMISSDSPVKNSEQEVIVRSKFAMFEYRPGWDQQHFAGSYEHCLLLEGREFKIKRKKATLINQDGYMPPLSMPF